MPNAFRQGGSSERVIKMYVYKAPSAPYHECMSLGTCRVSCNPLEINPPGFTASKTRLHEAFTTSPRRHCYRTSVSFGCRQMRLSGRLATRTTFIGIIAPLP